MNFTEICSCLLKNYFVDDVLYDFIKLINTNSSLSEELKLSIILTINDKDQDEFRSHLLNDLHCSKHNLFPLIDFLISNDKFKKVIEFLISRQYEFVMLEQYPLNDFITKLRSYNEKIYEMLSTELLEMVLEEDQPAKKIQKTDSLCHDEKHSELLQEIKRYENIILQYQCCICWENLKEMVFMPCHHLSTCQKCSEKVETCPICRKNISEKVKIFKS